MLLLCRTIVSTVNDHLPKSKIELDTGSIELYSKNVGDFLFANGYLNMVHRIDKYSIYGFHIQSLLKTKITVINQPNMQEPDMSFVVGIKLEHDMLLVTHWDGFLSYFNLKDLTIIKQIYTK